MSSKQALTTQAAFMLPNEDRFQSATWHLLYAATQAFAFYSAFNQRFISALSVQYHRDCSALTLQETTNSKRIDAEYCRVNRESTLFLVPGELWNRAGVWLFDSNEQCARPLGKAMDLLLLAAYVGEFGLPVITENCLIRLPTSGLPALSLSSIHPSCSQNLIDQVIRATGRQRPEAVRPQNRRFDDRHLATSPAVKLSRTV